MQHPRNLLPFCNIRRRHKCICRGWLSSQTFAKVMCGAWDTWMHFVSIHVQTRNLSLCIWITRLIYQTMQTKSMWLLLFSIFFSHVILGLEEVNMLEMTVASALAKLNYISWMNNDCLKLTFHFALRVARFFVVFFVR